MKRFFASFILFYLRFLAQLQIKKLKLLNPKLKIVGITGSAGKTSTLLACQAALTPNFRLLTNSGANSESGIPLALLGIKASGYSPIHWLKYALISLYHLLVTWQSYDLILLEMGIDSPSPPQNMGYLLSIVKPDIGIFLNVTSVHCHNFPNLEAIAQEKAKLVHATKTAIINSYDPLVSQYSPKNSISIPTIDIKLPQYLLPQIYQISFGAALALTQVLKLDQKTALTNLNTNFKLPPSRSSLFKGLNSSTIIDSSYNSSLLACLEMLAFLKTFPRPRLAILGDMRELGKQSATEHTKLYKNALKNADTIISVGPETSKYFGPKAIKFTYWWQAADYLKIHLPQNSTVLIKGSQNTIFLEELVKKLLANPSDSSLLCRQSVYWLKLKDEFKQKYS